MTQLTDQDRAQLAQCSIGGRPLTDWLVGQPPADRVRALLVRAMDRVGLDSAVARVMADHLEADRHKLYAENWPRRAAKLAAKARARGDHPHADKLQAALIALMNCANCGRPLVDPESVDRGIGPDCWQQIDPAWRAAITARVRDHGSALDTADWLAHATQGALFAAGQVR